MVGQTNKQTDRQTDGRTLNIFESLIENLGLELTLKGEEEMKFPFIFFRSDKTRRGREGQPQQFFAAHFLIHATAIILIRANSSFKVLI